MYNKKRTGLCDWCSGCEMEPESTRPGKGQVGELLLPPLVPEERPEGDLANHLLRHAILRGSITLEG